MFITIWAKKLAFVFSFMILIMFVCFYIFHQPSHYVNTENGAEPEKKYIKWVDFTIPYNCLDKALNYDIKSYNTDVKISWIDILSYLSSKYGGNYKRFKQKDMDGFVTRLKNKESLDEITKDLKYFRFYKEAYSAALGEFVGNYKIQTVDKNNKDQKVWIDKYGLKVFSPIASGFYFGHCDDFGNQRSYGFSRKHLGNDLMGSVGTPVIAVESGIVEAMGWNQYGGWRVGIRSFDQKRYYYFAHLKKDHPYQVNLKQGNVVKAGDVIGYLGATGYSTKENVSNIKKPHLHFGLQLIFDESQKDGINQIWINVYDVVKLLNKNKSPVYRSGKDYYRQNDFSEPLLESTGNSTGN